MEEFDYFVLRGGAGGDGHGQVFGFVEGVVDFNIVHCEENEGGVSAGTFVAVDESVIAGDVEEICGGHGGQVGMKVLAGETLKGLRQSGFQESHIADAGGAAEGFDLVRMDFENFLDGKEYGFAGAILGAGHRRGGIVTSRRLFCKPAKKFGVARGGLLQGFPEFHLALGRRERFDDQAAAFDGDVQRGVAIDFHKFHKGSIDDQSR